MLKNSNKKKFDKRKPVKNEPLKNKQENNSKKADKKNACPYAKQCGGCDYQGMDYAAQLKIYVCDTITYLHKALEEDKKVVVEGAQATLLDIDFGSYPFVTSSNPTIGGILTGTGLSATDIGNVYGVIKAYSSRVGEGPYVTELFDETGDRIRELGHEYGTTTGRPRRCGWLDRIFEELVKRDFKKKYKRTEENRF